MAFFTIVMSRIMHIASPLSSLMVTPSCGFCTIVIIRGVATPRTFMPVLSVKTFSNAMLKVGLLTIVAKNTVTPS